VEIFHLVWKRVECPQHRFNPLIYHMLFCRPCWALALAARKPNTGVVRRQFGLDVLQSWDERASDRASYGTSRAAVQPLDGKLPRRDGEPRDRLTRRAADVAKEPGLVW